MLNDKVKKKWDKHVRHPLIEYLTASLRSVGYTLHRFSDETEGYEWSRPLFDGYAARIFIWPEPKPRPRGYIGFKIWLNVDSSRYADVERQLGLLDCNNLRRGNNLTSAAGEDVNIMNVSLNWLMGAWEPKAGNFLQVFDRWVQVKSADWKAVADDVLASLQTYGFKFFDLLDEPIKLANVLVNLDNFPGAGSSRPASISPTEFAAVLFHDSGLTSRALDELRVDYNVAQAMVARGERDDMYLQIRKCRRNKLENWMKKENSRESNSNDLGVDK